MGRVLATALLLILAGCAKPPPTPNPSKPPSEVGRFVIVHSPEAERDTILLDTVTGDTWSRYERSDQGGAPAWEPMPKAAPRNAFGDSPAR